MIERIVWMVLSVDDRVPSSLRPRRVRRFWALIVAVAIFSSPVSYLAFVQAKYQPMLQQLSDELLEHLQDGSAAGREGD